MDDALYPPQVGYTFTFLLHSPTDKQLFSHCLWNQISVTITIPGNPVTNMATDVASLGKYKFIANRHTQTFGHVPRAAFAVLPGGASRSPSFIEGLGCREPYQSR